jgi:hypothetical protein
LRQDAPTPLYTRFAQGNFNLTIRSRAFRFKTVTGEQSEQPGK